MRYARDHDDVAKVQQPARRVMVKAAGTPRHRLNLSTSRLKVRERLGGRTAIAYGAIVGWVFG